MGAGLRTTIQSALALLSLLFVAAAAPNPGLPDWVVKAGADWQPPPEGVVPNREAAIRIARAFWISETPGLKVASEAEWLRDKMVTLRNGLWEVADNVRPNVPGGGLFIYISKRDGRLVGIYLTQ